MTGRADGVLEISWALRRRGLAWVDGSVGRELLFEKAGLEPTELGAFFEQMHRYAFRLFLRDIIYCRNGFGLDDLVRYVSPEAAERYLKLLCAWRIIEAMDDRRWRLGARKVRSFGETLEWYVAELFSRSFGCPAAWGVRATLGNHGGDYDVLALVEGRLTYVEVKSSPPKHIDVGTIVNFLRRIEDLGPHLSIFLEDTHLRLEDKIVPLFVEALELHFGRKPSEKSRPVQERRHLYSLHLPLWNPSAPSQVPPVFIASSRPSIEANLNYCLRRLLVPSHLPPLSNGPSSGAPHSLCTEDPTLLPEPPPSRWSRE